jgi:hypothetical protein
MIHATIHGILLGDARHRPSIHRNGKSLQEQVRFTISTSNTRTVQDGQTAEQFQVVQCCMRGGYATGVRRHLVAGKRVIVSGELVLLTPASGVPYLMVNSRAVEFIGGTYTNAPVDEDA